MLEKISGFIWGLPMIFLLFGTHIYLSFKTGFIQRKTFYAIKLSLKKENSSSNSMSPFQTLCLSLASTIGTGNIAGVGMAVFLGGPGAVFWCWLTGVLGIATKYGETLLCAKYKTKTKNGFRGGSMYVLENVLKKKKLAVMFSLCTVAASLGIGCMTQINSITQIVCSNCRFVLIKPQTVCITLALITAFVIFGGIKSAAKVCEKLVPFMAAMYVSGCAVILIINSSYLADALKLIVVSAFKPCALFGGFAGSGLMCAMRHGIAGGLFSNEAGLGSAPLAAASLDTKNPVRQALISSTSTFWDTVVICLMTGLVIVSTIVKNPDMTVSNGTLLTTEAFNKIPVFGPFVMVFGIITFAYSTVLGWTCYGEICFEYLFKGRFLFLYRTAVILAIIISPAVSTEQIWHLSDIFNAFMALPNLYAVFSLSNVIKTDTKLYFKNLK